MKLLLVTEYREGNPLGSYAELLQFASELGAETAMVAIGDRNSLPAYSGRLYLAEASAVGEFNPAAHRDLIVEVARQEQPDMIVLPHSSYGWDLAPRLAIALQAAQVSEVVELQDGALVVNACNAKLRRTLRPETAQVVVTLQVGAFSSEETPAGSPELVMIEGSGSGNSLFHGYEQAERTGVDLARTEVIVSAGRGIGKPENLSLIAGLAKALKGEYGASRPVVDAGWAEHNRQVGTTGQTVSPKLYVACGISGAIQHLAGMKKSDFVVAINTDRDAPIGEIADVLAVADLKVLLPVLTEKLSA